MRRIIHNSTAIAACLSLLAPNLALAELRIPDAEAEARAAAQADDRPEEAALLQAELATGLDADDLECADGADRPCADGVGLVTPGGLEVDLSESGQIVLAAGTAETPPEAAEAEPQDEAPAEDLTASDALEAEPVPAQSDDLGDGVAVSDLEAALAEQATEEDSASEAEAVEAETLEAEPAQPEAADAPLPEAETQAEAEANAEPEASAEAEASQDSLIDDLARALAGQDAAETPDTETPEAQPETTAATAAEAGAIRLGTGDVQRQRAEALPGLSRVLDEEVAAGLTSSALIAAGDRFMTPRGVVVERINEGAYRLAPPEAQMYRVQAGEMVLRAAEEDSPETEASREAAAAAEPSSAAALEAEEGSGEVTEQQVTEENSRSSSEDFQANLRDALSAATGQGQTQAQTGGSGGGNDLTRALLLGLGAVAVGTMLNNNRQVALSAPDRVVVTRPDGSQEVIKDEVALLRQPGSTVTTENFDDGSSRTIVTRADGSRVVTIRDADLRVLRRTLVSADGTQTRLIDDTSDVQPVDVANLPAPAPVPAQRGLNEDELRAALQREAVVDRRFTLSQVRNIPEVRALVAPVNIDAITFDTGSAAIRPDQAQQLASLGRIIQEQVRANPREIFMIEGHTDTVGSEAYNLALSDRRAESVALALAEYFAVPPENLVTQGYGEQFLLVRAEGDIRENRRASVRRITDLLAQQQ